MTEAYSIIPLSPLRKIIAVRMAEATRSIPHFRAALDAELDALLELRKRLNEVGAPERLSLNDFFIKASALALIEVPAVNSQWAETQIRRYRNADISVVTALEGGGLATPIVRAAESKSVWQISREVETLTQRARDNTLRMDEVSGGSFSISNLGMYGVDAFDAIINAPQCAILAIGCAKPRLVPALRGGQRAATVLRLTLSVDHRALDGATAALFLGALRRHIERPGDLAQ